VFTESIANREENLYLKIAEGDEQAFLVLFKTFSPLIRPFARNITHSEADAEDVIQETFIRVWLYRDKLSEIQNLKSWIFTVAAHECMRYMRQKLTYERKTGELVHQQPVPADASPLDFVQLNEINRLVKEAVNAMPPQRKLIYRMSRDQGLKPAAIAAQLSLSVGTVKNVLSFALKEIREHLVHSGITLGVLLCPFLIFC
jgi:RNA polymerase sigma-70 factor (ECF subfamily)